MDMAISIDQFGNVNGQVVLNAVMIKKEAIDKFGNPDETISSVIGKNLKKNTLARPGKILNSILDFIEEDHSEKSIETDE